MLLMETVICDSKLSQLSFSTTSAHSSNSQPFQKRKSPPISWRKKKACGRKTVQILLGDNLRLEIKGEIWCGNGGLSLKILDQDLFPPKISTKISSEAITSTDSSDSTDFSWVELIIRLICSIRRGLWSSV